MFQSETVTPVAASSWISRFFLAGAASAVSRRCPKPLSGADPFNGRIAAHE